LKQFVEHLSPASLTRRVLTWVSGWWQIVLFSAVVMTLSLTPSTYGRTCRNSIAREMVRATTTNLMWFSLLSALVSVILIRIVVVTALSYGLSRFALEMVVRVLVLELIPLTAALFVALRYSMPVGVELDQLRARQALGPDPVRQQFFPRVAASVFSVWTLGAVSCVMTLILAYITLYGFTPWALAGYTRVVGQVFNPAVTMILVLKLFFFSMGVSFIPMASAYYDGMATSPALSTGLAGVVRLFAVVLLIEVASLMGNYY
jgi:phospholipid/cholesterol/gamma-HCH transport system permease protein